VECLEVAALIPTSGDRSGRGNHIAGDPPLGDVAAQMLELMVSVLAAQIAQSKADGTTELRWCGHKHPSASTVLYCARCGAPEDTGDQGPTRAHSLVTGTHLGDYIPPLLGCIERIEWQRHPLLDPSTAQAPHGVGHAIQSAVTF